MIIFFSRRKLTFFSLFVFISFNVISQNKISPLLTESSNIPYYEAEDAIVTNFSTEPTLNYSASGQRTLQLNTYANNYNSTSYFAEYVVYIDKPGLYGFWYSGTPPGTKEDLYPSYSSPFNLIIDDKVYKKYREDVNVVENYAPGLYWVKTEDIELTKGYHKIRFEVDEKRRYDGKYYFYIDSFFLFNSNEFGTEKTPLIFPKNMDDRSIDNSFNNISYYLNIINNDPTKISSYLSLSNIYILIGDYLNAIKMLNRVLQLDPANKESRLLIAKSKIWNGDIDSGLNAYEEFLNQYPNSLSIWEEAGKIAAWVGKFDKSIQFFTNGITYYPKSISLHINLALTYLWNSSYIEGLEILKNQESLTQGDAKQISSLANVYYINGYSDYAINFYKQSLVKYPNYIELYLNLEQLYLEIGDIEKANELVTQIKDRFVITDDLQNRLDLITKKSNLKDLFIQSITDKISLDSTDINLRELLTQTYFWNGQYDKAILEYKAIIAINHLKNIEEFEDSSMDLFNNYDLSKIIELLIDKNITEIVILKSDCYKSIMKYKKALFEKKDIDESLLNLKKIVESINIKIVQNNFLYSKYDELLKSYNELRSKDFDEEVLFQKIKSTNWTPNLERVILELKELSKFNTGENVANRVLARIFLTTNNLLESEKIIDDFGDFSPKDKLYRYQQTLWNNSLNDMNKIVEISTNYTELTNEKELLETLELQTTEPFLFSDDFIVNNNIYFNNVGNEIQKAYDFKASMYKLESKQQELILSKFQRYLYNHQSSTYLIRYKIGEFYLQMEEYDKSLEQLNQVIEIDPYNISAKFKLARVLQLTGDWKNALNEYEKVFNTDPNFQSSSTMYNSLSKLHPEMTNGYLNYFVDNNRVEYRSETTTDLNINSYYTVKPIWIGKTYSYFKWDDIGAPRKFRVDDLLIKNTFLLDGSTLVISPQIGISIYNNKFDYISPIESVSYDDILFSGIYSSNLSISMSKIIDNYTVSIFLESRQIDESRPSNITNINSLINSYTISGYYPIQSKNINSLSFRVYGNIDNRTGYDENNYIFTFAGDFNLGLLINKTPWTTLTLYSATTYENSLKENKIYYTPSSVFVSKIGGTVASYLGKNGGVTSIILRLASGVYIDKMGNYNLLSVSNDGEFQLSWEKNSRTLFAKIYGSGSFSSFDAPDYWSLQGTIGFNISLYKLLSH